MRVHFQREIDKLKRQLLEMSANVERSVSEAVRAIANREPNLARKVLEHEQLTNTREVDVEEECLKILALHQPVAADLRYLVAVLKINHDLERIGDLAAHIAQSALAMGTLPPVEVPTELGDLATQSQSLLKRVLDAFVDESVEGARAIQADDERIDALYRTLVETLKARIVSQPGRLEPLLKLIHVARHLERIGDHATNIAEDLIYIIEGRIVRHVPLERQTTST